MQLSVGTELVVLFQVPWNPKLVLPPAPSDPLLAVLVAVTAVPLWVTLAFQALLTVWPLAKVQVTFQLERAADPAVTVTLALKPPGAPLLVHWDAIE